MGIHYDYKSKRGERAMLKEAKRKTRLAQRRAKRLLSSDTQPAEKEKAMELTHETQENEKKHRKDILVAEIKSAGYGAMQDINENQQSDYMDALDRIQKTDEYEHMNVVHLITGYQS